MKMNELTTVQPKPPAVLVPASIEDCLIDTEHTVELTAIIENVADGLRVVADADAVWSLARGRFWLEQAELVREIRRGVAELFEALGPIPGACSVRMPFPEGEPQRFMTVHINRRSAVPFVYIRG